MQGCGCTHGKAGPHCGSQVLSSRKFVLPDPAEGLLWLWKASCAPGPSVLAWVAGPAAGHLLLETPTPGPSEASTVASLDLGVSSVFLWVLEATRHA